MSDYGVRIPMRRQPSPSWVNEEDVNVRTRDVPLVGQKVAEMIISEEALAQIGAKVLEHGVREMGEMVARRHTADVQSAVERLLLDPKWLMPIVEDELRRCARAMVLSLWSDDEKKNLREWFDVFASKLQGDRPAGA